MVTRSYSFKHFMKCLTARDIHPIEYMELSTFASYLSGAEREEAIKHIEKLIYSDIDDKRLVGTVKSLKSDRLQQIYDGRKSKIVAKSKSKETTMPALGMLTQTSNVDDILAAIANLDSRTTVDLLDKHLMSLKRFDGKDLVARKALQKVIKDLPKLKGIDLKYQYILNWKQDIPLTSDSVSIDLLEMHTVQAKVAGFSSRAIKIAYVNGKVDFIYSMSLCHAKGEGGYTKLELKAGEENFAYLGSAENQLYNIAFKSKGKNFLGGECPPHFRMPDRIGQISFDYLGRLSREDKGLSWLPFDLHLVCPILLDVFDVVYVDYSDPLSPKLLNRAELEKSSFLEDIPADFERTFKKKPFALSKTFITIDSSKRASGVPTWIQSAQVIKSPVNGKTMKFVLQLASNGRIETEKKSGLSNCDSLNFWIDGSFYLFFEPESKVAGMIIQNT